MVTARTAHQRGKGVLESITRTAVRATHVAEAVSSMSEPQNRKVLLFAALVCMLFSIVPTVSITVSDIIYFSKLDWHEHCLNHLPPGQFYGECINNDPRPVSPALILWTLIGVAAGRPTFALGRSSRPKLLSKGLFAIIVLVSAFLVMRWPLILWHRLIAGDVSMTDAALEFGGMLFGGSGALSPILAGWLLGRYFRMRDQASAPQCC